jgi:tRNA A37 threonylcarbamoyladenosine synthetase subunit TsaC/SUA5/YrdC
VESLHLLDGGQTPGGAPSTLVRLRGQAVEVLRKGAIEIE